MSILVLLILKENLLSYLILSSFQVVHYCTVLYCTFHCQGVMAAEDKWTKDYVNNLFGRAGLDREVFYNISKQDIPLGIEGLIYPLKLPDAAADNSLKTGKLLYCTFTVQ